MASSGPLSSGTLANDATAGVSWTNPGNAAASDDSRATVTPGIARNSKRLTASNFSFSIPSGATINGIVVEIERSVTSTALNPKDQAVNLTKNAGTSFLASNKASASVWPTTDAYATYGTSTDLWGTTWTDTEVNASGFGVGLIVQWSAGKKAGTARVDHIRITVYYTEGGGATVKPWNYYAQLG